MGLSPVLLLVLLRWPLTGTLFIPCRLSWTIHSLDLSSGWRVFLSFVVDITGGSASSREGLCDTYATSYRASYSSLPMQKTGIWHRLFTLLPITQHTSCRVLPSAFLSLSRSAE